MDDAILIGRSESGVLVRDVGVESKSRLRFARRVVKKAVQPAMSVHCTLSSVVIVLVLTC